MNRRWTWAVLLIAMLFVSACRPVGEVEEPATLDITAGEDMGICPPDDEDCGGETAGEQEVAEEPTAEETVAEEPTAEPTALPTDPPTPEPVNEPTAEPVETNDGGDVPVEDPFVIKDTDWTLGPEDATVTLLEYADYLCPHCANTAEETKQLLETFPEDIRLVYRHFPLNGSPVSPNQLAVRAADSAGLQGFFFEYHELLFARQADWRGLPDTGALLERFIEYAVELELDGEQFEADINSPEMMDRAVAAYEHAIALQLRGTPTIFLNGRQANTQALSAPEDQWADFIDAQKALAKLPVYEMPEMTIDPDKSYLASVETEKGSFVIELLPASAPMTVNSFIFLAEEGWFDGITFHRVIDDFMAQTGDPSGTGMGGPGYTFENEIDPDLLFDGPGWVAMANAGPNTNGSQWFITYSAQPNLDGNYTIFGKVIEGMEVVDSLTRRDPMTNPDFLGDAIISVTIEEK